MRAPQIGSQDQWSSGRRKWLTPVVGPAPRPTGCAVSFVVTMAGAINLHRMPLLAARGPNAARVKLVCCRLRRQMHGHGDGGPHGFSACGSRTLLGFGDALIVTQPLAVGLAAASAALVRAGIASRSCSAAPAST